MPDAGAGLTVELSDGATSSPLGDDSVLVDGFASPDGPTLGDGSRLVDMFTLRDESAMGDGFLLDCRLPLDDGFTLVDEFAMGDGSAMGVLVASFSR